MRVYSHAWLSAGIHLSRSTSMASRVETMVDGITPVAFSSGQKITCRQAEKIHFNPQD
jgi:hypothetical protein